MTLTVQQLELRQTGIGASEAASLAGVGYDSLHELWMRKRGLSEFAGNSRTRWGNRMETACRTWYEETTGTLVVEPGTLVHPEHSWILATPDGIVHEDGDPVRIVEFKSRSEYMRHTYGAAGTDQCSLSDTCQLMWLMFVTGLDAADLCVTFSNEEPVLYHVRRDEDLIAALVERGREFWFEYVVPGVEPPGTPGERLAYLESRYPRNTDTIRPAPPEADRYVERWRAARAARTFAEAEEAEARTALCSLITDADGIAGEGYRVTWKAPSPVKVTAWKDLALSLGATPEQILAATTQRQDARRFTVKIIEDAKGDE